MFSQKTGRSTADACAPSFHPAKTNAPVILRLLTQDSPDAEKLERINEAAFPPNERNTIRSLFASGRDGNLDMLGIYAGDALAGFLAVRKFRRIRYLAYFAVAPERRCEGIGSAAIQQLKMLYPDCQIITEFEVPDSVHEIRRRRRDFYIRNGFFETGWYTFYDETEFQIACSEPEFDIRAFTQFLAYLNTIISDHIPQPYMPASGKAGQAPDRDCSNTKKLYYKGEITMKELLQLLKQNARLSNAELAAMLGRTEAEVTKQIAELEESGIIRGYSVIVDEELANRDAVEAYIELKITPQPDCGFDELARMISGFEEVEAVTLMSGGYDLGITLTGAGLRDIASFVAQRLATLEGVLSTRTHFVLKRYKEKGILIQEEPSDERGVYL